MNHIFSLLSDRSPPRRNLLTTILRKPWKRRKPCLSAYSQTTWCHPCFMRSEWTRYSLAIFTFPMSPYNSRTTECFVRILVLLKINKMKKCESTQTNAPQTGKYSLLSLRADSKIYLVLIFELNIYMLFQRERVCFKDIYQTPLDTGKFKV